MTWRRRRLRIATSWLPYTFVEGAAGFNSELYRYARALVRGAAERAKPNEERFREYTNAALPQLEQYVKADTPVYPSLDKLTLSFALERMREWLGPDDKLVRSVLGSESPDSLAAAPGRWQQARATPRFAHSSGTGCCGGRAHRPIR